MSFTTKGGSNSLPFAGSRKVSPKCNTGPRPQMQSLAPAVPMAIQGCPFFQVEHAKIQNQSCLRLESKKIPSQNKFTGNLENRESWCNHRIPVTSVVWKVFQLVWLELNILVTTRRIKKHLWYWGFTTGEAARNQPSNACSRMHSKILPYFSSSSRCFFWNLASTDSVDFRRVWLKPKMAVLDTCCFVSYSSSSSGQTSCHPGRSCPVTRAGKRPSTWKRLARWRQKHARVSSLSAAWVRLATCHGTAAFLRKLRGISGFLMHLGTVRISLAVLDPHPKTQETLLKCFLGTFRAKLVFRGQASATTVMWYRRRSPFAPRLRRKSTDNDSQGPRFHHWDMALEPGVFLVHKPMSNVIFWRLSRRMEFVASTWKTSPKPIHTQVLHTFLILFMQMKYKLDYKGFMQRFAKTLYLRRCSDKIVEVQHFTTAAPEDSHIIPHS